jgi:pseudaminic acid synthase
VILFFFPFDKTAARFFRNVNVPAYKIVSFEITDISLIEYVVPKETNHFIHWYVKKQILSLF